MRETDYYQILGVDSGATRADVRRAFRVLAMRFHPDQNPDNPTAEERFKLITQAYKVLINPKRRSQYDMSRRASQAQRRREAAEARRRAAERDTDFDLGDSPYGGAFEPSDVTGERKRRPWWEEELRRPAPREKAQPPPRSETKPPRDNNLYVDMTITSDLARFGGTQPLAISRDAVCQVCNGTGAKPGTTMRPCPECGRNPSPACPYCSGQGKIYQALCSDCHGQGNVRETKTLTVIIPPRSKHDQTICIPGEGMIGKSDEPQGDMIVRLHVKGGAEFERRDEAVYSEIHVTPAMAAMGGTVRVKTVDSSVDLFVPPGTQPGTVFRLEGVGPQISKDLRGDHYVTVQIVSV